MILVLFPRLLLLVGIIYLSINYRNPLLSSGLYTFAHAVLALLIGQTFIPALIFLGCKPFPLLIDIGIRFIISFLYFWSLDLLQGRIFWWFVLIIGVLFLI